MDQLRGLFDGWNWPLRCGNVALVSEEQATGVAGIYSGGAKWAVARFDIRDDNEPVFMEMKSEAEAREWYQSYLRAWETYVENHPERAAEAKKPELVATRLHWQVQQ